MLLSTRFEKQWTRCTECLNTINNLLVAAITETDAARLERIAAVLKYESGKMIFEFEVLDDIMQDYLQGEKSETA